MPIKGPSTPPPSPFVLLPETPPGWRNCSPEERVSVTVNRQFRRVPGTPHSLSDLLLRILTWRTSSCPCLAHWSRESSMPRSPGAHLRPTKFQPPPCAIPGRERSRRPHPRLLHDLLNIVVNFTIAVGHQIRRQRPCLAATSPEIAGTLAPAVSCPPLLCGPSDQDPKDQNSSLT
jgi:hypothetical protein